MKYMLLIYLDKAWDQLSLTARQQILRGAAAARAPAHGERAVSGWRPAAPAVDGHQRPGARRQTVRDRRSVCGNTRAARWLHAHRRHGSRRGDRHRRTRCRGARGYHRNSAGERRPADVASALGPARRIPNSIHRTHVDQEQQPGRQQRQHERRHACQGAGTQYNMRIPECRVTSISLLH